MQPVPESLLPMIDGYKGGYVVFMKKVLVSALLAAGTIVAVATPVPSAAAREIRVDVAPPAPREERVPGERRGYTWAPGYWQWNANRHRHTWVAGHWVRARQGYVYRSPEWVEREGRYHYRPSRWDRDGDGVPDSRDRHPNDPTRR